MPIAGAESDAPDLTFQQPYFPHVLQTVYVY